MAARFWVGGTGTWDGSSTTNWSATSGGAGGASAPTTTDTVTFDSNSGTGVVTTAAGATCLTTTVNSSTIELSLGANFTQTGAFTLTLGTVTLNSYNLTSTTLVSSNLNVRTINFGTGKWTLSGSGTTILNCGTMTGMVNTGSKNVEFSYAGSVGTRSITPASAAGGATESNCFNLKFLSGTDIVAVSSGRVYGTIDFDGFAGSFTTNSMTVFGDFKLSTGMTISASTGAIGFTATSGTKKITTNGKTIDQPITFDGVGGTFQLQDNCTVGSTRTVTLTNGTLDLNNNTLSCGTFSSSNSNIRSIAFGTSGKISLSASNATIWNGAIATNLSVTGEPVVDLTYTGSTGTRVVQPAFSSGGTYSNSISFNILGGSDTVSMGRRVKSLNFTGFSGILSSSGVTIHQNLTLSSTMTFVLTSGNSMFSFSPAFGECVYTMNNASLVGQTSFNFSGVVGSYGRFVDGFSTTNSGIFNGGTFKLKAGSTYTFTTGISWGTSSTQRISFESTTPGTRYTFSIPTGITVNAQYMTIKDNAATGGATFNAYRNLGNIDAGNNIGWDFLSTPVTTTTLAMRLGFGL